MIGETITGVYFGAIVHAMVIGRARMDNGTFALVTDQVRDGARLCYRIQREGVTWAAGRLAVDSAKAVELLAAAEREGEQRVRARSTGVDGDTLLFGPSSAVPLS